MGNPSSLSNSDDLSPISEENFSKKAHLSGETKPDTGKDTVAKRSPREAMTRAKLAEQFSIHRDRLWRTVQIRMDPRLYGRVDPDDVLQEAYMDAEKRLGHFAEELDCSAFVWLRLIVGQSLINVHRRHIGAKMRDASRDRSSSQQLRHQLSATSESIAYQIAANQSSPSNEAVRAEDQAELAAAIETLKPMDREVLTLRHFEDLSNKEVAELLEISEKNASIRYVRAIQRLKTCMEILEQKRK